MLIKLGWVAHCEICRRDFHIDDGREYSEEEAADILKVSHWQCERKENEKHYLTLCPACVASGLTFEDVFWSRF